jgi:hypothetical protein
MGLRSGGGSLAVAGSCGGGAVLEAPLDGGCGVVVTGPLVGGGGGGGTRQIRSLASPSQLPLHSSSMLGFWWVNLVD